METLSTDKASGDIPNEKRREWTDIYALCTGTFRLLLQFSSGNPASRCVPTRKEIEWVFNGKAQCLLGKTRDSDNGIFNPKHSLPCHHPAISSIYPSFQLDISIYPCTHTHKIGAYNKNFKKFLFNWNTQKIL